MLKSEIDINKESIIEVVGTQYEGRAANHKYLKIGQTLSLQRQKDNAYDSMALMVTTADGTPLGYLPKGQASIYASAIDTGRYTFSAEVASASYDPQRPILLVRITGAYNGLDEDTIVEQVYDFIAAALGVYEANRQRYLGFIDVESISEDSVIICLRRARLCSRIVKAAESLIQQYDIHSVDESNGSSYDLPSVLDLDELQMSIAEILKKYQHLNNEAVDIEDEDEYQRIQRKIREKRRVFKQLGEFCSAVSDIMTAEASDNDNAGLVENTVIAADPCSEIIDDSAQSIQISAEPLVDDNDYSGICGTDEDSSSLCDDEPEEDEYDAVDDIEPAFPSLFEQQLDLSSCASDQYTNITLILNGRRCAAADHSDAMRQICELAICVSPFRMARIHGSDIIADGSKVFCRSNLPISGYTALSNGLQLLQITEIDAVKRITAAVVDYCGFSGDLIEIEHM